MKDVVNATVEQYFLDGGMDVNAYFEEYFSDVIFEGLPEGSEIEITRGVVGYRAPYGGGLHFLTDIYNELANDDFIKFVEDSEGYAMWLTDGDGF